MILFVRICTLLVASALFASPAMSATPAELSTEFQGILDKHVFAHKGEGVDYRNLAQNVSTLEKHVARYNTLKAKDLSSPELKKSTYFNLYNAGTLLAITQHLVKAGGGKAGPAGEKAYKKWAKKTYMIATFGSVKPWESKVSIAGVKLKLDHIEHGLLRRDDKKVTPKAAWKPLLVKSLDARLHAAVNCGAIDCPPIAKEAFTSANVESLLQKNMTSFLINKFSLRGGKMKGSSIVFDWYLADFVKAAGGADKVGPYLAKFLPVREADPDKPNRQKTKAEKLAEFFNANTTITSGKYSHSYRWLVNDRSNY
jgi:hypothetical protein